MNFRARISCFATLVALAALAIAASTDAHDLAPSHDKAAPESVRYQLGLLVRGPTWTPERTPRTDSIQAGHMANIGRMWHHGALVAAGPFQNGGELRGVFVFRPGDDPLDSLMAGDSAIATRRLECRLYPWIGAPGFGEDYRRLAAQRATQGLPPKDSMVSYGWVMLQRGPKYDSNPSPQVKKLIEKHFAYAEKLRASGQLLFSGAVEGTGDLRGVLILKGDSADVARVVAEDPAVKAGRFTPRVMRWWTAWGNVPGH
jgi:uncharacterized protein YciI